MNSVRTYCVWNPNEDLKKFQLEKRVKNEFFSNCPSFILPFTPYISKSTNRFEKMFTYQSRSQRVEPILKTSKKLVVKSFHGTLTKILKAPSILQELNDHGNKYFLFPIMLLSFVYDYILLIL